jgi:hypothetical protein
MSCRHGKSGERGRRSQTLETEIARPGWSAGRGPLLSFLDRAIIDAGVTVLHETVFIELPVLLSIGQSLYQNDE